LRTTNQLIQSFEKSEGLLDAKIEDLKSEELDSVKIDLMSEKHGPSYDTNSNFDLSKVIPDLLLITELDHAVYYTEPLLNH